MKNTIKALSLLAVFFGASVAFAEDAAAGHAAASSLVPIGKGLAMGLAVLGGALGQAKAAASALEGMARNPQANLQGPLLLGMAFIETLVLFAFVISFLM